MEMRDLARRVRRRMRATATRVRYKLGLATLAAGVVRLAADFRHPIDRAARAALTQAYRDAFPEAVRRELEEAQRLIAHEFHFLGHATHHESRIAWSRDPASGRDWPKSFSPDIPYRGPHRLGDVKLAWELNKHQYFFTLGKAAWLTDDARYAREITSQIDHWIEDNPCHRGIHWISALESGSRVVSWILAYPFFAEHCDAHFTARMARSIAEHLSFVEQNLSIGRHPNTHLVGEAATLVIGGLFLDCHRSGAWVACGLEHLERQLQEQVLADGAHAEQSLAYHRFCLDQYHLAQAMLAANGRSLSSGALRRMEQMTQYLMDMLFPDGSAPAFGDCDDARGIWCRSDCPLEYRSLLALGALLFERADFKAAADGSTEELLWLYGPRALETFEAMEARTPAHTSTAYVDAGYCIMRGGWRRSDAMLVYDCGPLGHGLAGHGHADALSFQLYANGRPLFVDPGTYSYNLDYGWRDAFRGTRAHNTITIDGLDQSVPQDRMSWSHAARARCLDWTSTPWFDLADAAHDGYERLAAPVTHRRIVVFFKPDAWLIIDALDGTGTHEFELLLHPSPECALELESERSFALVPPDAATVHGRLAAAGTDVRTQILVGTEMVRHAWHSPCYGVREPSHCLAVQGAFDRSARIATFLGAPANVQLADTTDGALLAAVDRSDGARYVVFKRERAAWPADHLGIRFDGTTLVKRCAATGSMSLWAENFSQLVIDDALRVSCPARVNALALEGSNCEITVRPEDRAALQVQAPAGVHVRLRGPSTSAAPERE